MNCYKIILISVSLLFNGILVNAQANEELGKTVSGTVYDFTTGLPIAFAAVDCAGFSSTFTDMEGAFTIDVSDYSDVITVTSVGYHTKDVTLAGRKSVTIYIKEESSFSYQEEVNAGYFDIKQIYTTQSIAGTRNFDDKSRMMAESAELAFDGRIAGLNVVQRNGIKGAGSDLFLRGFSSLHATNQPLIVVDGMIYDINSYGTSMIPGYRSNHLGGIDLNDIEDVAVVRDAASIYGAKAANGVIFIRTNHAKQQATTIDVSVTGAFEERPDIIPTMDAGQYRLYANEMLLTSGIPLDSIGRIPYVNSDATAANYFLYRNSTDWQREVFKNNYSTNYRLAIKGGDDIALYALTVGYMKQGGTVDNSDYSRFNLRFNSDINISPRIILHSNIGFHYSERDILATGIAGIGDAVHQSRIKAPFLNIFDQNELGVVRPIYADSDIFEISNPVALLSEMDQRQMNYRLSGAFDFEYKVNDKFRLMNLIGVSFDKTRENVFIPNFGVPSLTVEKGIIDNQMKARVLNHLAVNNDFRLSYENKFGHHSLQGIAGARMNINSIEEDWGSDYNSPNDQIRTLGSGNYLLREKGGFLGEWSNLNWYATINYDFQKKYLLNLSASLDGSSRFGDDASGLNMFGTVFGFFPAASVAWVASSEPFMASADLIDLLKFRASYGLTGNDDIGNYNARRYYNTVKFLEYQGTKLGNLGNSRLTWEKNTKLNFGVDISILKERINISADYYQNKTTDLFTYIKSSETSGFDGYYDNHGGVSSKGIDLTVNGRIINKPFKWDMGLVVSQYKTEINELWGEQNINSFYGANIISKIGQPLAQFYGYKTNGVYSTSQDALESGLYNRMDNGTLAAFQAGDVVFVENKIDGIIDDNDMQVIGDATPDFLGELFTSMKYKDLSLHASVSFSYGGDVYNYMRYSLEKMHNLDNQTAAVLNRWQYEGQNTLVPRAVWNDPMANSRFSDRWIEDGSFAKLKSVTLSYRLPIKASFLKNAEAYITGLNLFVLSNYKGLDPEFSAGNSALLNGIDLGMIPQNRTFLLGFKVGL